MSALLQDLRYALRTLRRDAGFAVFAILIAGLGIGASATVFSVVNTLLLRPLPFAEPERLVWISNHAVAGYFAFYGVGDTMMTGRGEPERMSAVPVSDNFFQMLGVQPELGRSFSAAEVKWNGPKAVILSHALWTRRFASDPAIVGSSIT